GMDKNTLLSSFGKWVSPIFSKRFYQEVASSDQDKYVKKLTTPAYLLLFLHAQLQQREGLRAIADDVLGTKFQRELGFTSISASQLSRKHQQMSTQLLQHVFMELVQRIRLCSMPSKWKRDFRIIDSTTIPLCVETYKWATFRETKAGVKLHFQLAFVSPEDVYPETVQMTTARSHDRTQLGKLVDQSGITYVFDRGFNDYAKFDEYCEQGIFFVTRAKKNASIQYLYDRSIPENSAITRDCFVEMGTMQKRMRHLLRLVESMDLEGNPLVLITNRWDLSAEEIGDMYRSRWAIEIFFKWLKQHVKITSFYGKRKEAVLNQVFVALIAYCLLVLAKIYSNSKGSLLQIYRWLRATLWDDCETWLNLLASKQKEPYT
ncbi:IS4 family transposase, partial [Brevibacillus borstelensis]|uniref:IS4 family transposase n=1 Tax=Brevibacillus borstelensis TaxID=45462 RepID=UPI0030C0533A